MFDSLKDKPFRLMAIAGTLALVLLLVIGLATDSFCLKSAYPYAKAVMVFSICLCLVLCILTFIFFERHVFYYAFLELLAVATIYAGSIYIALFLSSLLMVLFLTEKKTPSRLLLTLFLVLEAVKVVMAIPYGVTSFFYYLGLELFSLCTVSCINLLFTRAYSSKEEKSISLDSFKLTDRQKDCIREVVLHNTTIKALAMKHNVSESAIKKDFARIYKVLNISGKADLKALFIGTEFHSL